MQILKSGLKSAYNFKACKNVLTVIITKILNLNIGWNT